MSPPWSGAMRRSLSPFPLVIALGILACPPASARQVVGRPGAAVPGSTAPGATVAGAPPRDTAAQDAVAQGVTVPGRTWDRVSSPGEAGWSAEQLEAAWRIADDIGSGAIVVVHHGRIVAEWGETTEKYDVFSARKQLLSGLLGIAAADGALALDATLGDLGIDDKGGLTDAEKSATVRDLLTSRSGVYHDAAYEARAHRRARPRRGSHPPGTFFHYNNWDFNALGTIFERVSGESVFEAFERRIAQPLEMEDFRREEDTRYERTGGSEHAAYLFEMTARDLARYGLLWLMRGNWGERRIIPGEWVDESTRPYVHPALNDLQSFGYLWWIYPATPGLFGASGKGNQKVVIWPERDLVVVHLASTKWLGIFGSQVGDRDFWRLFYAIAAADTSRDATEDPSFAQGPLRPAAGSHEE